MSTPGGKEGGPELWRDCPPAITHRACATSPPQRCCSAFPAVSPRRSQGGDVQLFAPEENTPDVFQWGYYIRLMSLMHNVLPPPPPNQLMGSRTAPSGYLVAKCRTKNPPRGFPEEKLQNHRGLEARKAFWEACPWLMIQFRNHRIRFRRPVHSAPVTPPLFYYLYKTQLHNFQRKYFCLKKNSYVSCATLSAMRARACVCVCGGGGGWAPKLGFIGNVVEGFPFPPLPFLAQTAIGLAADRGEESKPRLRHC